MTTVFAGDPRKMKLGAGASPHTLVIERKNSRGETLSNDYKVVTSATIDAPPITPVAPLSLSAIRMLFEILSNREIINEPDGKGGFINYLSREVTLSLDELMEKRGKKNRIKASIAFKKDLTTLRHSKFLCPIDYLYNKGTAKKLGITRNYDGNLEIELISSVVRPNGATDENGKDQSIQFSRKGLFTCYLSYELCAILGTEGSPVYIPTEIDRLSNDLDWALGHFIIRYLKPRKSKVEPKVSIHMFVQNSFGALDKKEEVKNTGGHLSRGIKKKLETALDNIAQAEGSPITGWRYVIPEGMNEKEFNKLMGKTDFYYEQYIELLLVDEVKDIPQTKKKVKRKRYTLPISPNQYP